MKQRMKSEGDVSLNKLASETMHLPKDERPVKKCTNCLIIKKREDFRKAKTVWGMDTQCKQCRKNKEKGRKRKKQLLRANNKWRLKREKVRRKFLATYKQEKGCSHCGFDTHPSALLLIYTGKDKGKRSSAMLSSWADERWHFELTNNTTILCRNCEGIKRYQHLYDINYPQITTKNMKVKNTIKIPYQFATTVSNSLAIRYRFSYIY